MPRGIAGPRGLAFTHRTGSVSASLLGHEAGRTALGRCGRLSPPPVLPWSSVVPTPPPLPHASSALVTCCPPTRRPRHSVADACFCA